MSALTKTRPRMTLQGRVLLVDDDPDILESLTDLLEPEGYVVASASEPQGAQRLAGEFRPDIALLDIKLGVSNGLDLVPVLKRDIPDLMCVAMTAFAETENAIQAVRCGADDYLRKPVTAADILRTLARCLQQQRLMREKDSAVAALKEREERVRAVMENVADGIITIDDRAIVESLAWRRAGRSGGAP